MRDHEKQRWLSRHHGRRHRHTTYMPTNMTLKSERMQPWCNAKCKLSLVDECYDLDIERNLAQNVMNDKLRDLLCQLVT